MKAKAAGTVRPKEKASSPGWVIENLSVGGVFVRCDEPLPVGSKVVTELLQQEGGAALKLTGVVVATRDAVEALTAGGFPGMGIRPRPR